MTLLGVSRLAIPPLLVEIEGDRCEVAIVPHVRATRR